MATQKEIADRLGVSISLVSRVLSGSAADIGIRQDTIDRVLEEAGRQKYAPNPYALALKGRPPKTLGVLVTDFNDPFLALVLHQLQAFSQPNAYTLFVCGIPAESESSEGFNPNYLQTFLPDGLIWLGGRLPDGYIDPYLNLECPVVHIGSGPEKPGVHHLSVDDVAASRDFYKLVDKMSISRIGWVADNLPAHQERLKTFLLTAAKNGLEVREDWIVRSDATAEEAGVEAARRMLTKSAKERPQLIFAAGDIIAYGVAHGAKEIGLGIPDDLALIGFDDIPASRYFLPRLSTFAQPVEAMVNKALDLIIKRESMTDVAKMRRFKPTFIARESHQKKISGSRSSGLYPSLLLSQNYSLINLLTNLKPLSFSFDIV